LKIVKLINYFQDNDNFDITIFCRMGNNLHGDGKHLPIWLRRIE